MWPGWAVRPKEYKIRYTLVDSKIFESTYIHIRSARVKSISIGCTQESDINETESEWEKRERQQQQQQLSLVLFISPPITSARIIVVILLSPRETGTAAAREIKKRRLRVRICTRKSASRGRDSEPAISKCARSPSLISINLRFLWITRLGGVDSVYLGVAPSSKCLVFGEAEERKRADEIGEKCLETYAK